MKIIIPKLAMKLFAILLFISLSSASCLAQQDIPPKPATDEIQVLIDVSGSMKQNDPQNLRVSATQLLINLLPEKANVSLWLFAEKTSLLSHTDAVDNNWRQDALKASKKIHSHGIYTHIEDAIQTSLEKGFSGNGNKNLIILTDGMVDISKDIMVSADSRERILSDWIPKLQLQKIKVQTIALSDQVDKELLDKLAFHSGGWAEAAESADQLKRLFLRTILKAVPKNTLPLENNAFVVDDNIHEFSLVIFKQSNSSPTQIVGPDQVKLTIHTVSESLSWFSTDNYDLITVTQPTPGEWHIEAAVDPDNQVMILTDLKLKANEFANFIGDKQSLPLTLHFTERNAVITRADFLDLVTINLALDQQPPITVSANKTEPGYFSHTFENLSIGKHTLAIVADGKTFKREITRDFEVIPTPITVETRIDNANRTVTLEFTPDIALLDVSSITITATLHQANREPEPRIIKEQNGKWLLQLAEPDDESLLIDFDIVAKNLDGNVITPALAPITIDKSVFTTPTDSDSAEQTAPSPAETDHTTETPVSTDQTSDSSSQNTNAWGITIGIVLAINLLFCGIGFFVYKMLKKAIAKQQQQLLEKLA